jgi:hypothetical protein
MAEVLQRAPEPPDWGEIGFEGLKINRERKREREEEDDESGERDQKKRLTKMRAEQLRRMAALLRLILMLILRLRRLDDGTARDHRQCKCKNSQQNPFNKERKGKERKTNQGRTEGKRGEAKWVAEARRGEENGGAASWAD